MRFAPMVLILGCLQVSPPPGQFICNDEADCPDDWVCGGDGRCYESELICYPVGSAGCAAGQGCYLRGMAPHCLSAGTIGWFGQCGDTDERCDAGSDCVRYGDDLAFCVPFCHTSIDCPLDTVCSGALVETEGNAPLGEVRFCEPADL